MKKIKKTILRILGSFMAFVFSYSVVSAQFDGMEMVSLYGVDYEPRLTMWERIISIVLSPITISIIVILALVIGITIFIKRKRKNAQKNS
jgi:predicted membrane protein